MTVFILKLIAVIAMAFDHIAAAFGAYGWDLLPFDASLIRAVGRLSFPIFAWCIANGWQHTRSRRKYFENLCLFAVLSQIPFTLALNLSNLTPTGSASTLRFTPIYIPIAVFCVVSYWYFGLKKRFRPSLLIPASACLLPAVMGKVGRVWVNVAELNVLYTLALGLVFLFAIEKLREGSLARWERFWLAFAVVLSFLAYGLNADYGTNMMGVVLIVALYAARGNKAAQSLTVLIWGVALYGWMAGNWRNAAATVLPALLILACNGKKGPSAKWMFYWFYPLHLLAIGMVNVFLKYGA